jgi:hypothetical protein
VRIVLAHILVSHDYSIHDGRIAFEWSRTQVAEIVIGP